MTRLANKFVNPANADEYTWPINHETEAENSIARTITRGANTAGTGLVRQQADDQPLVFQLSGTIFTKAMLEEMVAWYVLCKTQTIHFDKYDGDKYEVIITEFKPVQKKTIHNPKDSANAPLWFWQYTITMEVITVIDGIFEGIVT